MPLGRRYSVYATPPVRVLNVHETAGAHNFDLSIVVPILRRWRVATLRGRSPGFRRSRVKRPPQLPLHASVYVVLVYVQRTVILV